MARYYRHPGIPQPISSQFFLWTIRKQDQITRYLSMNIWSAVPVVLAIALLGFVTLETALQIIFFGEMATISYIWILIERRRSWMLGISDPKLKAIAHQAMIDYMVKKLCPGPECPKRLKEKDVCSIS